MKPLTVAVNVADHSPLPVMKTSGMRQRVYLRAELARVVILIAGERRDLAVLRDAQLHRLKPAVLTGHEDLAARDAFSAVFAQVRELAAVALKLPAIVVAIGNGCHLEQAVAPGETPDKRALLFDVPAALAALLLIPETAAIRQAKNGVFTPWHLRQTGEQRHALRLGQQRHAFLAQHLKRGIGGRQPAEAAQPLLVDIRRGVKAPPVERQPPRQQKIAMLQMYAAVADIHRLGAEYPAFEKTRFHIAKQLLAKLREATHKEPPLWRGLQLFKPFAEPA
ncbi:hypothetical protein BN130_689 [Cronobacter malonaticus 507]|nr:hypothetical protein BN130_689 [Cronobacter malonaticus 507]